MSWLRLVVVLLASAVGYYFGRGIDLSDQWQYFEALRTTSSVVFGVMGALLAIVYPEVVRQGFRATKKSDPASAGSLRLVVDPLAQSALLVVVVVILGPAFAWLSKAMATSEYVKGASFAALCMLTVWQVWILILVLRPLDLLRSHTEDAAAAAAAKRRIHQFGPGEGKERS